MSRSVLLQLARDSIEEVLQAQRTIDKKQLLQKHPLLNETIPISISLYVKRELKGRYTTQSREKSLLENIIIGAKKAAFEDKSSTVLTTSEYLHSEIELLLKTPEGEMSESDPAIIS